MKKMTAPLTLAASLLSLTLMGTTAHAAVTEAPSTVNATYVAPSLTRALKPGEKVDNLYTRNATQDYVLQKLTDHTYWFQRQYYGTIFYVGDKGVLLFDPLQGRAEQIKAAIASVTDLPITAIVYSHDHADHIGDAKAFTSGNSKLRIIASEETAEKMDFLNSSLPAVTETVKWPDGTFKFEKLKVELHGFDRPAHTDDASAWLLSSESIVHIPDLINPDQPPFWAFAGSENYVYFDANLEALSKLKWDYLSGGHGNVGSRADIEFYRTFLSDLRAAVGKAMGEVPWGVGVDASQVNAHTPFLPAWYEAIAENAVETLRPKYGQYYGFESATHENAIMVAETLFSYQ